MGQLGRQPTYALDELGATEPTKMQGWHGILGSRSEPLCARILKGRYFHDIDFMRATRKKHASSTWRAILAGREALQHGLVRRVVNGETTEIWRDRWILDHFGAQPITTRDAEHPVHVSDLLQDGSWNEGLIRDRFLRIDAKAIMRQPIGRGASDFGAWNLERSGIYSVRSSYRLLH